MRADKNAEVIFRPFLMIADCMTADEVRGQIVFLPLLTTASAMLLIVVAE